MAGSISITTGQPGSPTSRQTTSSTGELSDNTLIAIVEDLLEERQGGDRRRANRRQSIRMRADGSINDRRRNARRSQDRTQIKQARANGLTLCNKSGTD